jgi:threonylcarbamoyladenosine tRNA methylthiotransferase MtaB
VRSFFIQNFGCRATQADGSSLERQLLAQGLSRASTAGEAEVVVLNTCTVTAAADQEARAAIRRVRRQNPGCRIVVTGCYAQRAPAEIASLAGVDWVVGNSHKHALGEIVASGMAAQSSANFVPLATLAPQVHVGDIFAHTELLAAPVFENAGDRTRPNLKVQDGCNNRCSFCVIPSVRGRSRSLPLQRVLDDVNQLVISGYREVVLSGINLGRWGRDARPQARFGQLVRAILEHTALERLRISSVEPMDWSDELIGLLAGSSRIAKHAHVPLQSGSDTVLRRMHRKYRPWHYVDRIRRIRGAAPQAAIGADVMVGFPGETGEEFKATQRLVEELPLTYLHVFTYSPRPGTPAAEAPAQVPVAVARERSAMLRQIAVGKKREFMRSFVGATLSAITLSVFDRGHTEALTDNYLKLLVRGRHAPNQWIQVTIESLADDALVGYAGDAQPAGKHIRARRL